jgi:ankyrin repeat protein
MGSLRNLKTESHTDKLHVAYVKQQKQLCVMLDEACQKNDPALLLEAMCHGADINFVNEGDKFTFFTWCYEAGSFRLIHPLISSGKLDLSLQDPDEGDTPLHRAAGMAHYGVVRRLINLGSDLTIKNKRDRTPLGEVRWALSCRFDFDSEFDRRTYKEYQRCERILIRAEEKAGIK